MYGGVSSGLNDVLASASPQNKGVFRFYSSTSNTDEDFSYIDKLITQDGKNEQESETTASQESQKEELNSNPNAIVPSESAEKRSNDLISKSSDAMALTFSNSVDDKIWSRVKRMFSVNDKQIEASKEAQQKSAAERLAATPTSLTGSEIDEWRHKVQVMEIVQREQIEEEEKRRQDLENWVNQINLEWNTMMQQYVQDCEHWDRLFKNDPSTDTTKLLSALHSMKPSAKLMTFHRLMDKEMTEVEKSTAEMHNQLESRLKNLRAALENNRLKERRYLKFRPALARQDMEAMLATPLKETAFFTPRTVNSGGTAATLLYSASTQHHQPSVSFNVEPGLMLNSNVNTRTGRKQPENTPAFVTPPSTPASSFLLRENSFFTPMRQSSQIPQAPQSSTTLPLAIPQPYLQPNTNNNNNSNLSNSVDDDAYYSAGDEEDDDLM